MARSVIVFASLLLFVVVVGWRLASADHSKLATFESLGRARDEARRMADAVAAIGQDSRGVDFYKIRRNRAVLRSVLFERIRARPEILEVEVLDRFGAPVLLLANEPSRAGAIRFDRLEAEPEEVRYVRVPVRPGSQPSGDVRVAISSEMIDREIEQLQRSLRTKILLGAAAAVGTLALALAYVVHLVRKNRALEQSKIGAERAAYRGLLASGLAHEIRNPLNAMNMNLQMLEEEIESAAPPSAHDWRELLVSTQSEVRRLERLVNEFLQYARPTAPKFEPRDLNEVLRAIASFLQADFRKSDVELAIDLEPLLPSVDLDEAQLRQALMNVLVNARQALVQGGKVTLRSRAGVGGDVLVEVVDNGPGIEPGALERIFEPFFTQRRGGTGLGLPIARQIIERHGGRMEVTSVVGTGTTIRLRLPRRHPRETGGSPGATR